VWACGCSSDRWRLGPIEPRERLFRWRINSIKATPAKLVGFVDAPDAETAAIKEYAVKERDREQLVALRDG
jgi:hypothetical protein